MGRRDVVDLPDIGIGRMFAGEGAERRAEKTRQKMAGTVNNLLSGDCGAFVVGAKSVFEQFGFNVEMNQERNVGGWGKVWANRNRLREGEMVDIECWGQEKSYGNFYVASRVRQDGVVVSVVLPGRCSEPRSLDEVADSFPEKNFLAVFERVIGEAPLVDGGGELLPEGGGREVFVVVGDNYRRVRVEEMEFPKWEESGGLVL